MPRDGTVRRRAYLASVASLAGTAALGGCIGDPDQEAADEGNASSGDGDANGSEGAGNGDGSGEDSNEGDGTGDGEGEEAEDGDESEEDDEPDVEHRWSRDQWQMAGIDAGNTAHSPEGDGPTRPVAERWAFTPEIENQDQCLGTQPMIHDGSAYVAANDGRVWAIDLDSGDQLWRRTFDADGTYSGIRTSMAVDDDHLYVPVGDSLHALSTDDGETVWSDSREARVGNLTLYGQRLIAPVLLSPAAPRIVQWDVEDGASEEIHRFDSKSVSEGIAVVDGTVVIHVESSVYGIDLETGEVAWDYQESNWTMYLNDPVTDGERVYAASGSISPADETVVSAVDLATGEHLWRYAPGLHIDDAPAVFDDTVLLQADHSLRALDAESGEEIWTLDQPGHGTPAVVGDRAYVNVAETVDNPYPDEQVSDGYEQLTPVVGIAGIDLQLEAVGWERGLLDRPDPWGNDDGSTLSPSPAVAEGVALFTQYGRGAVAYEAEPDGESGES